METQEEDKNETFIEASDGKILYNVVKEAFSKSKIKFTISNIQTNSNNKKSSKNGNNNISFMNSSVSLNKNALLVWYDTVKEYNYFSSLLPWQIVNRIPNVNLICRKAPFIRLIQRIRRYFPHLYYFVPKSYILPLKTNEFIQLVAKHNCKYIIKPDNGSLGAGIKILEPKMSFSPSSVLSIAQEYAESYLIDNRKFDLRIYILLESIDPLRIFVYRDGVARFCSKEINSSSDSQNVPNNSMKNDIKEIDPSLYSQITNTAINKNNPNLDGIESITKTVSEVFHKLHMEHQVDIDALWRRIDTVAVLTILSAYGYLLQGLDQIPSYSQGLDQLPYSKCFQILGFDVLLDKNLNPVILEVNYRPSLETDTDDEKKIKLAMLSDAFKIVGFPLNCLQKKINDLSSSAPLSSLTWKNFVNSEFKEIICQEREINIQNVSKRFVQVYPPSPDFSIGKIVRDSISEHNNMDNKTQDYSLEEIYHKVIDKVKSMPTSFEERNRMPVDITDISSYMDDSCLEIKLPPSHGPNITEKLSIYRIEIPASNQLPSNENPKPFKINEPQTSKQSSYKNQKNVSNITFSTQEVRLSAPINVSKEISHQNQSIKRSLNISNKALISSTGISKGSTNSPSSAEINNSKSSDSVFPIRISAQNRKKNVDYTAKSLLENHKIKRSLTKPHVQTKNWIQGK